MAILRMSTLSKSPFCRGVRSAIRQKMPTEDHWLASFAQSYIGHLRPHDSDPDLGFTCLRSPFRARARCTS